MTHYAIGDIQGCYNSFQHLLNKINFNPSIDTLYLVGDLVNRGPESLKVLQWVYKNQDNVISTLGNHDIYLLARHAGLIDATKDETIQDILQYKDNQKLITWLKTCPLLFQDDNYIIAHAGIYPKLELDIMQELSDEFTINLRSIYTNKFLKKIFGNKPNFWSNEHPILKRIKFMVNACTRMRYLNKSDFSLEYKFKSDINNYPDNLIPWFDTEFHPSINKKIIFGHWATLGLHRTDKVIALDTGCVWKKQLSALNLNTFEIIQVNYSG